MPHEGRGAFPAEHRSHLCLATAALAIVVLLGLAGCQTPPQTTAPAYGAMVPPPGTGMVGQPAQYGSWATAPQGAAYPPSPSPPPMPGPATAWQGAAAPAAPAPNSWSWSQPAASTAPPSLQQYGNQLSNQANQYQQSMTNQAQQYANQMQAQPQQWTNQAQQSLANQQQQLGNQWQSTANQYQQGLNNQMQQFNGQVQQNLQAGQQQLNQQMQQAMPQYPAGPQQQTANGSWWPFSNTSGMPPARATPAVTPRY
jgi:hypothetical protein